MANLHNNLLHRRGLSIVYFPQVDDLKRLLTEWASSLRLGKFRVGEGQVLFGRAEDGSGCKYETQVRSQSKDGASQQRRRSQRSAASSQRGPEKPGGGCWSSSALRSQALKRQSEKTTNHTAVKGSSRLETCGKTRFLNSKSPGTHRNRALDLFSSTTNSENINVSCYVSVFF